MTPPPPHRRKKEWGEDCLYIKVEALGPCGLFDSGLPGLDISLRKDITLAEMKERRDRGGGGKKEKRRKEGGKR